MCQLRNRLEESHKDLYQWFLLHQECLLLQQDDDAQCAFLAFTEYLLSHLAFENSFLLAGAANAGLPLHWPLKVYEKEHEKIEKMLQQITGYLQQYYPLAGREKRLALLALLDAEQTFRHVMEHHEQREEKDLFLHLPDNLAYCQEWLAISARLDDKYVVSRERLKTLLGSS